MGQVFSRVACFPKAPLAPAYLYDNVFKMCAICKSAEGQEVSFPLEAKDGHELLHFQPAPGVWMMSGVPKQMLDAKAGGVKKRPSAKATAEPKAKMQKSEAPAEPLAAATAAEQPDQSTPPAVAATEPAAKPKLRVRGKTKFEDDQVVGSVFMVHARKGNVRAYACAKCGPSRKLLVEISQHATTQYLKLLKGMLKQMAAKVDAGICFENLKAWAQSNKRELLG